MKTNVSPVDRLDGLEIERYKTMIESRPFALVMARIAAELDRARTACERSDRVLEARRAQGAAAALRTVLEMPERLLAEMRQKRR